MPRCDVAIVGAGIVGLAHALIAARQGRSVEVFERSHRAVGASVRNFGMYWPVGVPTGRLLDRALRAGEVWRETAAEAGFWLSQCGSLHLAYHGDEMRLLEEFVEIARAEGRPVELLTAAETRRKCAAVREDGLRGSMWSPTEMAIDSREAVRRIAAHLEATGRARFHFARPVVGIESGLVHTASGESWEASDIFICSGDDFQTLFPREFLGSGFIRCKLQMMRTAPQPGGWRLGPHLAGGLTLRHYRAFEQCPSLPALRRRIAEESPDFDRWGIHVMVAQNGLGELVLGDSHEYGDDFDPVERQEIEALILSYARRFLDAPDLAVAQRWHGIYGKLPDGRLDFVRKPLPGVTVVTGVGGLGMTTSFGLAQEVLGEVPAAYEEALAGST